ncbi:hypothetical protein L3X38_032890 [Prunus dulcis]|uniref:Uncharacterized protein n=1 Tax=Prunus dulcis TaxID=3755 RepID=A0AAD4VGL5_PRUDU|nr:hypothetical protein L3X38_032890 [Prunus dulcis]
MLRKDSRALGNTLVTFTNKSNNSLQINYWLGMRSQRDLGFNFRVIDLGLLIWVLSNHLGVGLRLLYLDQQRCLALSSLLPSTAVALTLKL